MIKTSCFYLLLALIVTQTVVAADARCPTLSKDQWKDLKEKWGNRIYLRPQVTIKAQTLTGSDMTFELINVNNDKWPSILSFGKLDNLPASMSRIVNGITYMNRTLNDVLQCDYDIKGTAGLHDYNYTLMLIE